MSEHLNSEQEPEGRDPDWDFNEVADTESVHGMDGTESSEEQTASDSELEIELPNIYAHLAFVAGATGITGREVVAALADRGIETIAHIREDSPYVNEWIEYFRQVGSGVDTTAWEQEEISLRLADVRPSLVFCLLGSSEQRMKGDENFKPNSFVDSYKAVDLGLTSMLIRACVSAGEENLRFILASAVGTDENSSSPFLQMKAKAEDFLIQSGLNYTIVRVGAIAESDRGGREQPPYRGLLGMKRRLPIMEAVEARPLAETLVDVALTPDCVNRIFETDL
ncbi:MAG: NAD(P)H-binding protein [bacterium]